MAKKEEASTDVYFQASDRYQNLQFRPNHVLQIENVSKDQTLHLFALSIKQNQIFP